MSLPPSIHDKLDSARRDLLELSTRNRLVDIPRKNARANVLEIVDERSEDVFRILRTEGKSMGFLPAQAGKAEDAEKNADDLELTLPAEEASPEGPARRYTDLKLQTRLTPDALQKRLLRLYYQARTFSEEQGVNVLFLALGALQWYEEESSQRERFAPLLLLPIVLERPSAAGRFRITMLEEDLAANLTLQVRLKNDFRVQLPDLPDEDELTPAAYFAKVSEAIAGIPRWQVLPDAMTLGLFSFAKLLMYRDLDPAAWPADRSLPDRTLIRSLLQDGFREPSALGDDVHVDELISVPDLIHVHDADSSQTLAIEEVRRGGNLVIQGPPGTGKSQTITNIIASAVKQGKRVLFVAEKMAALEVVYRRLNEIQIGDMCLELHSHKAQKRAVLDELQRTLSLGPPKTQSPDTLFAQLTDLRSRLNRHADELHRPIHSSGRSPFAVLGELIQFRSRGAAPVELTLPQALSWSSEAYQAKIELLRNVVQHCQAIGTPAEHPWRGVRRRSLMPSDVDRILQRLPPLQERLQPVSPAAKALADLLGTTVPGSLLDADRLAQTAWMLIEAPPMDRKAIVHEVWKNQRPAIDILLAAGREWRNAVGNLEAVVNDQAWIVDLTATRKTIESLGRWWLRWLNGEYREAYQKLASVLKDKPPISWEERLQLIDRIMQAAGIHATIRKNDELGRNAFGSLWNAENSDWSALATLTTWEAKLEASGLSNDFRRILSVNGDLSEVQKLAGRLDEVRQAAVAELTDFAAQIDLDFSVAFRDPAATATDAASAPLEAILSRIELWQSSGDKLRPWIDFHVGFEQLAAAQLESLAQSLYDGRLPPNEAVDRFRFAYLETLLRSTFADCPELAQFDGSSQNQVVDDFKSRDRQRIWFSRCEVANIHYASMPKRDLDVGGLGIVRQEIQKKRRLLPIRKLLASAGRAVQAIKPVFMMSPLSVAQFLEPGAIEFDLLVFDEASQVRPVEAIGAVARAKQIVVVGDDKQLPPTRFFNAELGHEDDDEEDFQAGDIESILGMCIAQNMPQKMLRWHYRSRHHSLIALSNREFYEGRLQIIPSPYDRSDDYGLRFQHVPDGRFDRGGSAVNRAEARAVASAVMEHARLWRDLSLGVAAFSVKQRDAILDELELLRREEPDCEEFFTTNTFEPFFVKNLENVQGDERDVIFISVGYAKDAKGAFSMNFGPLSNQGGERRLNVLITRAKLRCVVFSSITADDIDLNRATGRGPQTLKAFLAFAKSGVLDGEVKKESQASGQFENEVAETLRSRGFVVDLAVGVCGMLVDLAIRDPDLPGRHLLGIECDGAAYRAAASARDRDRLRQQALENNGWLYHRLWIGDWHQRPEEQLQKILEAVERAKTELKRRDVERTEKAAASVRPKQGESMQRDKAADSEADAAANPRYVEAAFALPDSFSPADASDAELADIATRIIRIEGPVHRDEVSRRLAALMGASRTGNRIKEAAQRGIDAALKLGRLEEADEFVKLKGEIVHHVRTRADVESSGLRKADMLPPEEIAVGLGAILEAAFGANREAAAKEVARMFGFATLSGPVRQTIDRQIDHQIAAGLIEERNDILQVGAAPRANHAAR